MPEAVTVVGGSWAALVAADALAGRGREVRLLLPQRGVGGGFATRPYEGRRLELGLRVLELEHESSDAAAPPPLDAYVPGPAAHLPWLPLVADYVEGLVGADRLMELRPSRMVVDGRLHDDIFLTSDPRGIAQALSAADRTRTAASIDPSWGHGAGVLAGPLGDLSLERASLDNHGSVVHERLIAPFVHKLVPGGASRLLAQLRRRVWTPVFWPATVWESCTGAPLSFRPRRPQLTVADGGLGALVDAQLARLRVSERIRIETVGALKRLRAVGDRTALAFSCGRELEAEEPVVAVPATELFPAADVAYAPERARTVVAWADVHVPDVRELPDVTHVVDPSLDALRITTGGAAARDDWQTVCVELRADLEVDEHVVAQAVRTSLERSGMVAEGAGIRLVTHAAADTFPLPTAETADAFAAARSAFDERGLAVDVIGGARDLAGDYLNEQVVAGIACADRRS